MSRNFTIKLLNATELLQQANAYTEIDGNILTRGLKGTFPTNTDEERALVKSYQGKQTFSQLSSVCYSKRHRFEDQ